MMAFMSYWLQGYTMERGYNVHWARKIKDAFQGDIRLTAVGSIVDVDLAEEIIANGDADFVAMCRPLMADPEMPRKAAQNRKEDIRPCLRCNACAMRLGGAGANGPKEMNCAVNPLSGLTRSIKETVLPPAVIKKKVAVVGGGVAGLTAVSTLVERGHDVTLYEKSDVLGGQVVAAAAPPIKIDMKAYLAYLNTQIQKLVKAGKVRLLMNTEATAGLLAPEGYDAVIIAVGSEPIIPKSIPGITKSNVMWAADAETKYADKVGQKVVIVGAGDGGMEAAIDFKMQGKDVEIIDILERGGGFFGGMMMGSPTSMYKDENTPPNYYTRQSLSAILTELGVEVQWGTGLKEVKDGSVVVTKGGVDKEIECDNVLLAMGVRSRSAVAESLRHSAPETECVVVGDAKQVGGNISFAVNGAFQAAWHI